MDKTIVDIHIRSGCSKQQIGVVNFPKKLEAIVQIIEGCELKKPIIGNDEHRTKKNWTDVLKWCVATGVDTLSMITEEEYPESELGEMR